MRATNSRAVKARDLRVGDVITGTLEYVTDVWVDSYGTDVWVAFSDGEDEGYVNPSKVFMIDA